MTPATIDWTRIIDSTWPAAQIIQHHKFTIREGQGGGSRVSAATANRALSDEDLSAAEQAMRAMDQPCLFMIRPGEEALDQQLEVRGYRVLDPVNIYRCDARLLTDQAIPRVTVFTIWEPLAIMHEIWERAGIGPARLAVMARAGGPKTGLLMRRKDTPAGAGFVAMHEDLAMVHALEILPEHQRQGLGQWAMRASAFWALDNGARTLSVICTKANEGANALYRSLGMEIAGTYHYRVLN